jgi:hypothetical protein
LDDDGPKYKSDVVLELTDIRAPALEGCGSRYALNANRPTVRMVPTARKYLKSGMASFSDAPFA